MKVYITKYALTNGIKEVEVLLTSQAGMVKPIDPNYVGYLHSTEYKTTFKEAIATAESMRLKKIASLEKQIERLKNLKF